MNERQLTDAFHAGSATFRAFRVLRGGRERSLTTPMVELLCMSSTHQSRKLA
jgi:hypothetical protein